MSALRLGQKVVTRFSGRLTEHRVTSVEPGVCQGGVLVKVDPPVPGARDPDNPWHDGSMSAAWFEPAVEQLKLL